MSIKNLKERPELYDSYDVPAREFKSSPAYRSATMPSWMREAIAPRAVKIESPAAVVVQRRAAKSRVKVKMLKVEPAVRLLHRWEPGISIAVLSVPAGRGKGEEARREDAIRALRALADQIEGKEIRPGPVIVDIPS